MVVGNTADLDMDTFIQILPDIVRIMKEEDKELVRGIVNRLSNNVIVIER